MYLKKFWNTIRIGNHEFEIIQKPKSLYDNPKKNLPIVNTGWKMIYFFKGQESYGIEEDVIKPKSMKYLILWKELKKKKKK